MNRRGILGSILSMPFISTDTVAPLQPPSPSIPGAMGIAGSFGGPSGVAEDLVAAIAERKIMAATMPEWVLDYLIKDGYWDNEGKEGIRIDGLKSVSACHKSYMKTRYGHELRMKRWLESPAERLAKKAMGEKFKNAGINRSFYD